MKKIIAIVLTALLLVASAACAETLTLSNIQATVATASQSRDVDLGGLTAKATVGLSGSNPTVYAVVSDGANTLVSGTAQIVGDKVVVAIDGIDNTYSIALSKVTGNSAVSKALTAAIGTASLANINVSDAISAVTSKIADGADAKVPTGAIMGLVNKAMKYADKLDAASLINIPAVKKILNKISGTGDANISYNKDSGAVEFSGTLKGATVKGTANLTIGSDEVALSDVDAANAIDITKLTAEQRTELKNAVNPLANSLAGYAVSLGLNDLLPAA